MVKTTLAHTVKVGENEVKVELQKGIFSQRLLIYVNGELHTEIPDDGSNKSTDIKMGDEVITVKVAFRSLTEPIILILKNNVLLFSTF